LEDWDFGRLSPGGFALIYTRRLRMRLNRTSDIGHTGCDCGAWLCSCGSFVGHMIMRLNNVSILVAGESPRFIWLEESTQYRLASGKTLTIIHNQHVHWSTLRHDSPLRRDLSEAVWHSKRSLFTAFSVWSDSLLSVFTITLAAISCLFHQKGPILFPSRSFRATSTTSIEKLRSGVRENLAAIATTIPIQRPENSHQQINCRSFVHQFVQRSYMRPFTPYLSKRLFPGKKSWIGFSTANLFLRPSKQSLIP
jgi:hypothetical protein